MAKKPAKQKNIDFADWLNILNLEIVISGEFQPRSEIGWMNASLTRANGQHLGVEEGRRSVFGRSGDDRYPDVMEAISELVVAIRGQTLSNGEGYTVDVPNNLVFNPRKFKN